MLRLRTLTAISALFVFAPVGRCQSATGTIGTKVTNTLAEQAPTFLEDSCSKPFYSGAAGPEGCTLKNLTPPTGELFIVDYISIVARLSSGQPVGYVLTSPPNSPAPTVTFDLPFSLAGSLGDGTTLYVSAQRTAFYSVGAIACDVEAFQPGHPAPSTTTENNNSSMQCAIAGHLVPVDQQARNQPALNQQSTIQPAPNQTAPDPPAPNQPARTAWAASANTAFRAGPSGAGTAAAARTSATNSFVKPVTTFAAETTFSTADSCNPAATNSCEFEASCSVPWDPYGSYDADCVISDPTAPSGMLLVVDYVSMYGELHNGQPWGMIDVFPSHDSSPVRFDLPLEYAGGLAGGNAVYVGAQRTNFYTVVGKSVGSVTCTVKSSAWQTAKTVILNPGMGVQCSIAGHLVPMDQQAQNQPAPNQPPPNQPPPNQPQTSQPAPNQPQPNQPAPNQPSSNQPTSGGDVYCPATNTWLPVGTPCSTTSNQPTPNQPAPNQPQPNQPTPKQPSPNQPPPNQPPPSQPAPNQPPPSQPAPNQPPSNQPTSGGDVYCPATNTWLPAGTPCGTTPNQPAPNQPSPNQPAPNQPAQVVTSSSSAARPLPCPYPPDSPVCTIWPLLPGDTAAQVVANPDLARNGGFLRGHPDVAAALRHNPQLRQQLNGLAALEAHLPINGQTPRSFPGAKRAQNCPADSVWWCQFAEKHPQTAQQLVNDPSLADSAGFLHAHHEVAGVFRGHPERQQQLEGYRDISFNFQKIGMTSNPNKLAAAAPTATAQPLVRGKLLRRYPSATIYTRSTIAPGARPPATPTAPAQPAVLIGLLLPACQKVRDVVGDDLARQLIADPGLARNRQFLRAHPDVARAFRQDRELGQQLNSLAALEAHVPINGQVPRSFPRSQHAENCPAEVVWWCQFAEKHPQSAQQLLNDPSLAQNPAFLHAHHEVAGVFHGHPERQQQMQGVRAVDMFMNIDSPPDKR